MERKLEVNSKLEAALVVLAVNAYAARLEVDVAALEEVVAHLNSTATVPFNKGQVMEALEELYTNNNEFALLGQQDPDNED